MNNYCINLKKRKNKPYCKLLNKEIEFTLCRECDNKEYKKSTSNKKKYGYKWTNEKKCTIIDKRAEKKDKNAQ